MLNIQLVYIFIYSELFNALQVPLPVLPELKQSGEESPHSTNDQASVEDPEEPAEPVVEMLPIMAMLPKNLADPLARIWEVAENQSIAVTCGFTGSLRDIRYQVLQRRRAIYDGVYSLVTMHDGKQNLMEAFRAEFNMIPIDMRFDLDCIAEFHLRVLEMRELFWDSALQRRIAADNYVTQMSQDVQIPVFIHRTYCEGSALIQAELNRYFATLHILFDYSKSMTGFDYLTQYHNIMEEALEIIFVASSSPATGTTTADKKAQKAKAGKAAEKAAAKGGKGADPVPNEYVSTPFRVPISSCILPDVILELPVLAPTGDDATADKSKAAKKATPAKV